jgi:prolyl 4-hydroxylase
MKNIFKTHQDLPECTELGFKVVDCPEDAWQNILKMYEIGKKDPHIEGFPDKDSIIKGGDPAWNTEIFDLTRQQEIRDEVHRQLLPLHEEWSGKKLIPAMVYGIRSYLDNVSLLMHVDRVATHHISAIIIVDRDEREPWPLHIEDHTGKLHKVFANPGQIILYESAKLLHGRPEAFQGNYFRNFYVHYKLADWEYVGTPMNN